MRLERLRNRLEEFLSALTREIYLATSGQKEEASIAAVYREFADCFEREALEDVLGELASAKEDELKRLTLLREYVAFASLDNQTREVREELLNREGTAQVDHPDGPIPFRLSFITVRNEPRREARERLVVSQHQVIGGLTPLLKRGEELLHETASLLPFGPYLKLFGTLSGIDLPALRGDAERFLKETEELYRDNADWFLRKRLGLKIGQAKKHDMEFLLRGHQYDPLFPERDLMIAMRALIAPLGLDLEGEGHIVLDLEPRPNKSARAFCATVRVPQEIYLVVAPAGGQKVYRDFLHELGHALHYAYVDPEMPVEFRRLGDYSVTESFAFLFDHLMLNPVALKKGLGIEPREGLLRFLTLGEIYLVRRYFAKLIYEMVLHDGRALKGKGELYREIMTNATGVDYSPEPYLYDVDPHFYCARYLRAWMMEAVLSRYLRERYDEDWFRNPNAGLFLKELFAPGQRDGVEELASRLGHEHGLDPLIDRLSEYLS